MHIAALGSSFAAGPSIPPQLDPAARRSGANYPSLLAKNLNAKLTDLSSSGATLLNVLSEPQQTLLATFPPQLERLPADADVVTLTAGGNDLGYSAGMIAEAAKGAIEDEDLLGAVLEGMGLRRDGGGDFVGEEEVARRFVRIIDAVLAKAPKARIFLVEYLAVFGPETKVLGDQPLGEEGVGRCREVAEGLRRAYERAARERPERVVLVPVAGMSEEAHALGSDEPWIVGFTRDMFMRGGAPFHPNAQGHVAVAGEVERCVRETMGL